MKPTENDSGFVRGPDGAGQCTGNPVGASNTWLCLCPVTAWLRLRIAQTGSFTLVDGYATITGSIFINSTSTTKIFITLSESPPVTTAGSTYNVGNLVAGAVGIASFTVGAYHTIVNNQVPEIVINTNDNSTLNYLIVD